MSEDATNCDRASKDMYTIIFKARIKAVEVAAMIVSIYKDITRCTGTGANGKRA